MQLKRGKQQSRKSKPSVEYEIKTYGSRADRNRSPGYSNNQYSKRSPQRHLIEEGDIQGEMEYINPNEINTKNNFSIRSPIRIPAEKNKSKKYQEQETGERTDKTQTNEYSQSQIPSTALNLLDSRREKLKRSPKTINLGETPQEVEFNIKSVNRQKKKNFEK